MLALPVFQWTLEPDRAREWECPSREQFSWAKRLMPELAPGRRREHKPRVPPAPGVSTSNAVSGELSQKRLWEFSLAVPAWIHVTLW